MLSRHSLTLFAVLNHAGMPRNAAIRRRRALALFNGLSLLFLAMGLMLASTWCMIFGYAWLQ